MEAYLDHAATTPVRPEAVEAMTSILRGPCGNPSGAHGRARGLRRQLDDARDELAAVLGCEPGDVVFTSGGTEADNLAVLGIHDRSGGRLLCSAVEHPAVLRPVEARGGRTIPVDGRGVVDLAVLDALLDESVTLVSVMAVNNEVGVVQPIPEIVGLVRDRAPRAVFHTDAVQAVPWLPVDELTAGADLISVSAHKFGGPGGVGALVVRGRAPLAAQLVGGGQERERRSGTPNVAGAVAMAAAASAAAGERAGLVARSGALRDRLVARLVTTIDGCVETGAPAGAHADRVAGIAHLRIRGVESEALLFLLDRAGVSASAASSCASGAMGRSHVLEAMGAPADPGAAALRLSLGWTTTTAEIDHALEVLPAAVARLRDPAVVGA